LRCTPSEMQFAQNALIEFAEYSHVQLNFPTGPTTDLPLSPIRWTLPMLLIEIVLVSCGHSSFSSTRCDSVVVSFFGAHRAKVLLDRISKSCDRGRERLALCDVPHVQASHRMPLFSGAFCFH
jgi:hypothetical protein